MSIASSNEKGLSSQWMETFYQQLIPTSEKFIVISGIFLLVISIIMSLLISLPLSGNVQYWSQIFSQLAFYTAWQLSLIVFVLTYYAKPQGLSTLLDNLPHPILLGGTIYLFFIVNNIILRQLFIPGFDKAKVNIALTSTFYSLVAGRLIFLARPKPPIQKVVYQAVYFWVRIAKIFMTIKHFISISKPAVEIEIMKESLRTYISDSKINYIFTVILNAKSYQDWHYDVTGKYPKEDLGYNLLVIDFSKNLELIPVVLYILEWIAPEYNLRNQWSNLGELIIDKTTYEKLKLYALALRIKKDDHKTE